MLSEKPNKPLAAKVWTGIGLALSGLFIITAIWVFLNRQLLADEFMAASYTPTQSVATVAERSKLTPTGTRIFYATHPAISSPEDFNTQCPRQEQGSAILGCYTGNDKIYIYNLTNEKLDGMEEVTAVHELLHAVWHRTSTAEQERLTKLLNQAYQESTNADLKTRMEYYQRTEPGEFTNELHSILGTEQTTLPAELETYYAQFFDRQAVLALHANYSQVYSTLLSRSEELYALMTTLSASIEQRSAVYTSALDTLNRDISTFNSRARSGNFGSTSQFNAERAALLARSTQLEAQRGAINADIATYDGHYQEYQKIASEIKVLNDSVDSFRALEAAPSL